MDADNRVAEEDEKGMCIIQLHETRIVLQEAEKRALDDLMRRRRRTRPEREGNEIVESRRGLQSSGSIVYDERGYERVRSRQRHGMEKKGREV